MFNDSLSVDQLLGEETSGGEHGKTTVLEFLGLHELEFSGVFGLEAEGIESEVTRDVGGTEKTGLVKGDVLGFDPADFGTDGLGLGNTGTEEQPEDGVNLGEVGDGRASDLTVEENSLALDGFTDEETDGGKHGNTSMGQFSLTVSLEGSFIGLGSEAEGIEETNGGKSTGDGVDGEGLPKSSTSVRCTSPARNNSENLGRNLPEQQPWRQAC